MRWICGPQSCIPINGSLVHNTYGEGAVKTPLFLRLFGLGASMVKWITLAPCMVFSERDSKLYTSFEFCEENNHRHFF